MVLMATIVTLLMSSYQELSIAKNTLNKNRTTILEKERLHLRLEQILSKMVSWREVEANHYMFTFDHGPDLEPSFRGEVEGMFYLDHHRLCMVTWPNSEEPPRIEVLAKNIENFSFAFFNRSTGEFERSKYPDEKPLMVRGQINGEVVAFFL